jgi:RimJ/RimL family protein N-acetyltransferase
MKLNIRILQKDDVKQTYVDWFSNKEVIRYSNNQYRTFTYEGQISYVNNCLNNPNIDLYGIFDKNHHIGNVSIIGLNSPHKRAEITYVIGNTDYWRKGVGHFAISSIIELAKNDYKLNKLFASLVENNLSSRRLLEKNCFVIEGKRNKHLFFNGTFYNQLDYGLLL